MICDSLPDTVFAVPDTIGAPGWVAWTVTAVDPHGAETPAAGGGFVFLEDAGPPGTPRVVRRPSADLADGRGVASVREEAWVAGSTPSGEVAR
jgi:hypothetical protein